MAEELVPGGQNLAFADEDPDPDFNALLPADAPYPPDLTTALDSLPGVPRLGSQSLPRQSGHDVRRLSGKEGARKVDSLPVNLRVAPFATQAAADRGDAAVTEKERKRRAKSVMRQLGHFVQKVARQITSVSALAKAAATRAGPKPPDDPAAAATAASASDTDDTLPRRPGGSSPPDGGVRGEGTEEGSALARGEGGKTQPGVVGIQNHGNTCYMNAVLQCLSNTERLLVYFITDQYKDDVKRGNKRNAKRFGTHGELTEGLAGLLRALWADKYAPDLSVEFKSTVGRHGAQYRGAAQHDAQEFLAWLLDKVHEDLNRAGKKKYRANKSSYGRSDVDVAAEALANHARCNNSFIYDIFQASYRSSLACPSCGHRSNTFDPFLSVSLPIPHKTRIPVCVVVVRTGATPAPTGLPDSVSNCAPNLVPNAKAGLPGKSSIAVPGVAVQHRADPVVLAPATMASSGTKGVDQSSVDSSGESHPGSVTERQAGEAVGCIDGITPPSKGDQHPSEVDRLHPVIDGPDVVVDRDSALSGVVKTPGGVGAVEGVGASPRGIWGVPLVRWGLLLDQDASVRELREGLATNTGIGVESLVLLELDGEGFAQTFGDGQSVYDLSEIDGIYALETPPTAAHADPSSNQKAAFATDRRASTNSASGPASDFNKKSTDQVAVNSHSVEGAGGVVQTTEGIRPVKNDGFESEIPIGGEGLAEEGGKKGWEDRELVMVVLNKLIRSADEGCRQGTPHAFLLSTSSSFIDICAAIERALFQPDPTRMEPPGKASLSESAPQTSTTVAGQGCRLRVINDYEADYFLSPDQEFPLRSEIITKSLENWVGSNGPAHIKVVVEWDEESVDWVRASAVEARVEDDESVRQVKVAQQQTVIGTLDECFQVYTQEERLDADNAWLCPSCRKYQQGALKALSLWSLPEVLVIHLKRFRQDAAQRTKLNTLVTFPITGLDLRHHVQKGPGGAGGGGGRPPPPPQQTRGSDVSGGGVKAAGGSWLSWKPGRKAPDASDEFVYDLYAVCNHYGNMQGGHYTAFCKHPVTGQWHSFNDHKATEMRVEEVVTRAAYLIFYHKRGAAPPGGAGGGAGGDLRDWLQRLQGGESLPRAVTSHSLDDLLDKDADITGADSDAQGLDDSFRATIPLYTEFAPPSRIKRAASARPGISTAPPHPPSGGEPTDSVEDAGRYADNKMPVTDHRSDYLSRLASEAGLQLRGNISAERGRRNNGNNVAGGYPATSTHSVSSSDGGRSSSDGGKSSSDGGGGGKASSGKSSFDGERSSLEGFKSKWPSGIILSQNGGSAAAILKTGSTIVYDDDGARGTTTTKLSPGSSVGSIGKYTASSSAMSSAAQATAGSFSRAEASAGSFSKAEAPERKRDEGDAMPECQASGPLGSVKSNGATARDSAKQIFLSSTDGDMSIKPIHGGDRAAGKASGRSTTEGNAECERNAASIGDGRVSGSAKGGLVRNVLVIDARPAAAVKPVTSGHSTSAVAPSSSSLKSNELSIINISLSTNDGGLSDNNGGSARKRESCGSNDISADNHRDSASIIRKDSARGVTSVAASDRLAESNGLRDGVAVSLASATVPSAQGSTPLSATLATTMSSTPISVTAPGRGPTSNGAERELDRDRPGSLRSDTQARTNNGHASYATSPNSSPFQRSVNGGGGIRRGGSVAERAARLPDAIQSVSALARPGSSPSGSPRLRAPQTVSSRPNLELRDSSTQPGMNVAVGSPRGSISGNRGSGGAGTTRGSSSPRMRVATGIMAGGGVEQQIKKTSPNLGAKPRASLSPGDSGPAATNGSRVIPGPRGQTDIGCDGVKQTNGTGIREDVMQAVYGLQGGNQVSRGGGGDVHESVGSVKQTGGAAGQLGTGGFGAGLRTSGGAADVGVFSPRGAESPSKML